LRGGEFDVTAYEQETKNIVPIVGLIDLVHSRTFDVGEVRYLIIGRQRLQSALAPHRINRGVLSDHDKPRRRIAWRAILRPRLERA
jgi:hypothetical protein